jgi:gallate decarboxylase subunit D
MDAFRYTLSNFKITTASGSYDVTAGVQWMGADLLVGIWGGEKPHIGAVSIAESRPSLADPDRTSATASVFCVLGHKEDELAKATAEKLAQALQTRVVVAAGIHWDDIGKEGLQRIMDNCRQLVELILEKIAAEFPATIVSKDR